MIHVVFKNDDFVICDKDAEVLSVPAREKNDLRYCLGRALEVALKTQIFPVHRLDFEVSGLIMYALNAKSHADSQNWFQNKLVQKKYQARTLPQNFLHWPENLKTDRSVLATNVGNSYFWKTQILRGKKRSYESVHGEWAETKAVIADHPATHIDWYLYPLTGKAHQLRLELSRRGFPIVGDTLYGSAAPWSSAGIALRAIELDFSSIQKRRGLPEKVSVAGWSL
jgi:tRNA pseudouridine32 synthase / 23S rRNA pseudouridine746 synthase